jgi:uncharacterized membrane protein YfhO
MKTHLKLFYIFFSKHVEYHTPVEILSHVSFCTRVNISTCQQKRYKTGIFFFLIMLYSSFVMNTLEKFPGAATGAKHTSSKYSGRIKDI